MTNSGATMPNTAHVPRQPIRTNKDAAIKGMPSLARPVPKLAMPIARPRLRTNHWAIVTLMTQEPSKASPAITKEQRTRTNCQKLCTRLESNSPAPSIRTPRTRTPRPPWRSIHGPSSGTISAATPISKVRINENAPRETFKLLGDRFEKNAERAGEGECSGDVDENADADDVPAVEITRLDCRTIEFEVCGHEMGMNERD